MISCDTIAAIATPPGAGGIAIVRISGEGAFATANAVFRANCGRPLEEQRGFSARLGKAYSPEGELIDEALALVFHSPRSYTGEDAVEIMCHGGELPCREILSAVCAAGARAAARGEFTRRACLNGRISLNEAEAVCELINSASRQGERAAAALASGALSKKLDELKAEILAMQAHLTACIDFPEEDVEEPDYAEFESRLGALVSELEKLAGSYNLGADLIRGVPAVIVGSPNVGKSTLLNLLAGAEKALVTPIAGTTRDVLEQRISLGGTTLLLADTAGIRESEDPVEKMGIERALQRVEEASLIFAVFDSSRALDSDDLRLIESLRDRRAIAVVNKTDLPQALDSAPLKAAFGEPVFISAREPQSLEVLDEAVARLIKTDSLDPNAPLLATERQRESALRALEFLKEAREACAASLLDAGYAMLSQTLEALSELKGENASESVLDEVFSRFCVGK
ncbi:MAG: tRNA uridine-5-carboxymethylaminomethyl(34) synthesis GTPase MnmE [Oscillospiraceae bacterium]|nr:tRNA uridine-5-carboxymethylaminomethyl(34) synthesis GTPase MnmE [Oscillospiraceae bacterium]